MMMRKRQSKNSGKHCQLTNLPKRMPIVLRLNLPQYLRGKLRLRTEQLSKQETRHMRLVVDASLLLLYSVLNEFNLSESLICVKG